VKRTLATVATLGCLLAPAPVRADEPQSTDDVVRALRDEVKRSLDGLSLPGAKKPYYLAYRASEGTDLRLAASFGALIEDQTTRGRGLRTDLRVGDYTADSGNFIASGSGFSWAGFRFASIPLEDPYDSVRRAAWLAADEGYKSALDSLDKKLAERASQAASSEQVDDFSREPVTHLVDTTPTPVLEAAPYRSLVKALSRIGAEFPDIQTSTAHLGAGAHRRWFVSSEGSIAVELRSSLRLDLVMTTQADDGMKLADFVSLATCAVTPPVTQEALVAEGHRLASELEEIRRAPIADDYTGPVLFEGRAAAQVLRRIVGESLSGTPPPESSDSGSSASMQSELAGQVGQQILPPGYGLEDNPLLDHVQQLPLAGCYKVDDEGVATQKVTLVANGVLRTFLMSRTPRKGFLHSNGHAREEFRGSPRGHIGNLVLTATGGLSGSDLRRRLIAEARAAKRPYAIVIDLLEDNVTRAESAGEFSGRSERGMAPLVMWKVSLDGKQERVRGGHLGEIPLRILKEIVAAGRSPSVASEVGYWGAADSVASPALLFKELQINKPREPSRKLPVAPRPDLGPAPALASEP
jgi:TldD protein